MGRNKKPTAVKVREGNRGKRPLNANEPKPSGQPKCPTWIKGKDRKYWKYIIDTLSSMPGLLTSADSITLGLMAKQLARFCEAEADIAENGLTCTSSKGGEYQNPSIGISNRALSNFNRMASKFGMDPSSRAGMDLPTLTPGENAFDEDELA